MGREYDGILDRLESKEADVFLRGSAADVLFECARCGQCCLGGAYTTVDDRDINRIAAGMGLEPEDIREAFTTSDPENRPGKRMIKNVGPKNSCTFYDAENKGCTIYESRPAICRTHPMMNVRQGYRLTLYNHCLGASNLINILRVESDNLGANRYHERLNSKKKVLKRLKIKLLIHILQRQGSAEKSEVVAQLSGIKLPLDMNDLRKASLAYLLLSIDAKELDGYNYEGIQVQ
jgi:Fe-S-cluster containining protein